MTDDELVAGHSKADWAAEKARTLKAAHGLADMGFHVFPMDHPWLSECVGAHKKIPCDGERGKHPERGFVKVSTIDHDEIDRLFKYPRNVGIYAKPSGLVVIDEDGAGEFERAAGDRRQIVPATFRVATGKGDHYYFRRPESMDGWTKHNAEGGFSDYAINVRDLNGYVVAAGSRHANGKIYKRVDKRTPVYLPEWAVTTITTETGSGKDGKSVELAPFDESYLSWRDDPIVHHPHRNDALASAAGWCRKLGVDRRMAEPFLRGVWERLCRGGHCDAKAYVDDFDAAMGVLDNVYRQYASGTDAASGEPETFDEDNPPREGAVLEDGVWHIPPRRTLRWHEGRWWDADGDDGYEDKVWDPAEQSWADFVEYVLEAVVQTGFERDVESKLHDLRIADEARKRLAAELRPASDIPEILTLAERLRTPPPPTPWRVEGWIPKNSRTVLAAQYKAGKTTLVTNTVRSLVDGDQWLDSAEVFPIDGNVVILDLEMSPSNLDRWLDLQKIKNQDRVVVIPLRGKVGSLDITQDRILERWAGILRDAGAGYVVLDPLRPLIDALGLDEHRDAGRVLVPFDGLLAAAGVSEAMVVHHMGHDGERSRGDSRIRDWPDVEIRYVREDENPASPRYISAFGRDVDQPETLVTFDGVTGRVGLGEGNRGDAVYRKVLLEIAEFLENSDEPQSKKAIEEAVTGRREKIRKALDRGLRKGDLELSQGPKGAHLFSKKSENDPF